MALIKCPECSNEVSDKATSCPKCGHPLRVASPQPPADLDALIKQKLSSEGKIAAIKLYRDYNPSAGLAEGKQYVELVIGGEGFLDGVQCMFPQAKDSPVAQVSKGQSVTVRGRIVGKMGNLLVRPATLRPWNNTLSNYSTYDRYPLY